MELDLRCLLDSCGAALVLLLLAARCWMTDAIECMGTDMNGPPDEVVVGVEGTPEFAP